MTLGLLGGACDTAPTFYGAPDNSADDGDTTSATTDSDSDSDFDSGSDFDHDSDSALDSESSPDSESPPDSESDTSAADSDSDTHPAFCKGFALDADRVLSDIGYLASAELGGRAPGTSGNEAARDFIVQTFGELGLTPLGDSAQSYLQSFDCLQTDAPGCPCTQAIFSSNVVGMLTGQGAEIEHELVVVGAHYDHLSSASDTDPYYPGADDNASGVAVMLELARAFVCADQLPLRSVIFAAWNAEECGLLGSRHFVESPPEPIADMAAAYSIDCVAGGNGTGMYLYGQASPGNVALFEQFAAGVQKAGLMTPLKPVEETSSKAYTSDQFYFEQAGVPAVMIATLPEFGSSSGHVHVHTVEDTLENLNRTDLEMALGATWAGISFSASPI